MNGSNGEVDYDVDEEAWAFLEGALGAKTMVSDFLRNVGVPAHCDLVTVAPYGEREVIVSASAVETGLTVILVLGEERISRPSRPTRRYGVLYGVVRDLDRNDLREAGMSGPLVTGLVETLGSRGYEQVRALCSRDAAHHGYYVWARLGFNGFVPEPLVARAVSELGLARDRRPTLESVFRAPEGPSWWRRWGATYAGRIKMLEGSRSYRYYLDRRGVP